VTGQWIKPGAKLGGMYQEANLPVVRRRLYKAGIRLATVLDKALEPGRAGGPGRQPCRAIIRQLPVRRCAVPETAANRRSD
jgi:hypothetical protein